MIRLILAETVGVELPALVPEDKGEDLAGGFLQGWRETWLTAARPLDLLLPGSGGGRRAARARPPPSS